ncbi:hypothetical protein AB836_02235 [Rickettsiales bacterium (ex Bugula neritina AB1)]|nr:hypothetical protein AB836_02235 [Rickettsiales bacterium (ex Bugula neritina AB1)]
MVINIIIETSITTFIPSKLFYFYKNHRNYKYIKNFKEEISNILFFLLLLDNFLQYLYSTLIANLCVKYLLSPAIIGGFFFILSILFESIAKKIVIKNPERSILEFSYYTYIINITSNYIMKIFSFSKKTKTIEDDNLLFEINMKSTNDAMTGSIMKNVLKIKRIYTEDIMTPKEKIFSLEMKNNYRDIMQDIKKKYFYNHIPDYIPLWSGTKYNFVKLLNVKVFLSNYIQKKYELENAFEDIFYVSAETSTYKLLHIFKTFFKEFAFVVNEEGDVKGIVTTQDLLEEIVGDDLFENKNINKNIVNKNNKIFTINGNYNLEELNKICNLKIPTKDIYTIGEFIINNLKRIPKKGEMFYYENCTILILMSNEKQIISILLSINN